MATKKIYLYITDAGGGHRGSANALKAAIEARGLDWAVEIVNIYRQVWPAIEPGAKYLNFYGEDAYNWVLEHNWTRLAVFMRPLARWVSAFNRKKGAVLLRDWLRQRQPDLALSCMPFVNDLFTDAHREARVPIALLCTDLVDRKPYMWFTPGIAAHAAFIGTGCEQARAQAAEAGAGERALLSGLVIHPKYFDPALSELTPAQARAPFNLEPGLFTVLIVMGGYGGPAIRDLALAMDQAGRRWQVLACCGKNEGLKAELDQLAPSLHNRLLPIGFTAELHRLMRAADVMVSKPGPASLMEAIAMGCPLVLDDAETMPQEEPNAEWVSAMGAAIRVSRRKDLAAAVAALAGDPDPLRAMREAIAAHAVPQAADTLIPAMRRALGS